MDSLLGILIILLGLLAAGLGIRRLMHMSDTIRALKSDIEGSLTKARAEVKQLEAFLENVEQKADERRKTLEDLREKLKNINDALAPETRELRPAIYIATDRRAKGDVEYRAKVTCSRLGGDWGKGRDYVIWSKDEETARRGLETKFTPSGGFIIENVMKSRDPL